MPFLNQHYHRILLALFGIGAIAVAAVLSMSALSFGRQFEQRDIPPGDEIGIDPPAAILDAANRFTQRVGWEPPHINNKDVPLFTSVLLVQRGEKIYDLLDPNEDPLRPPMTNAFLLKHDLDYRRSDVAELDPDNDGFTNLEEFFGGIAKVGDGATLESTDPRDPTSHPPFTDKLRLVDRLEEPYIIRWAGASGDAFNLRRPEPAPQRMAYGLRPGDLFFKEEGSPEHERFLLEKSDKREVQAQGGITREVWVLTIRDRKWDENFTLEERGEADRPVVTAVFRDELGGLETFGVRKGETFALQREPDVSYKVVDVNEQEALISPVGSEAELIRIPRASRN
jgi:hypothetical protein